MIPPLSRIGPVLPIVIVSVKVMLPCLDCAQSLGLSQTNSLYSQLPDQTVYPIIFNRRWGYLTATFLNLLDTPLYSRRTSRDASLQEGSFFCRLSMERLNLRLTLVEGNCGVI